MGSCVVSKEGYRHLYLNPCRGITVSQCDVTLNPETYARLPSPPVDKACLVRLPQILLHCSSPCSALHPLSTSAPSLDYVARMRQAQEDPSRCPLLMLAPMESLGDWRFRRALMDSVGGFDEACTGRSSSHG